MSQPVVSNPPARKPRPSAEVLATQRSEKKEHERILREEAGTSSSPSDSLPNTCSTFKTVEEEQLAREQAVVSQMEILRRELPHLLRILSKIPDPRNPRKCRHRLAVLMLYGLLMFVLQFASRREVNREMSRPQFEENLKLLFPELETIPHADTLYRLLRDIDSSSIEEAHIALVKRFLRSKKFRRFLINGAYPVAIDGSQKFSRDWLFDVKPLERKLADGTVEYYVYVLEASLSFHNGMVIPLLSEFLEYDNGDISSNKQDCELRAFHRLAERLKKYFPRLPIILLLDGLYANGPVMERCREYDWQFIIVLKNKELPSIWQEFEELKPLQTKNRRTQSWGGRQQQFTWVTGIEYEFTKDGKKYRLKVNVVVCEEGWKEIDDKGNVVNKKSRHAWLSNQELTPKNVHELCNLGARYRWGIEAGFLVEKHQGYSYEHAFALDWNAMKGYHLLMRMGHMFNSLARFARHLSEFYKTLGVRPTIKFIREILAGPWLKAERILAIFERNFQLRFG